jgi:hypothetical protein
MIDRISIADCTLGVEAGPTIENVGGFIEIEWSDLDEHTASELVNWCGVFETCVAIPMREYRLKIPGGYTATVTVTSPDGTFVGSGEFDVMTDEAEGEEEAGLTILAAGHGDG